MSGYEAALRAEIAKIAELIPHQDLVIQLDKIAMFSDAVEGSGMGLAMVRKQADVVGGRITVESDGTRGTCFRLFWPRVPLVGEMAA